jgi:GNAT superfamily N-acetyltransferase
MTMSSTTGRIRPFLPEDAEPCSLIVRACLRQDSAISTDLKEELMLAETTGLMCERAKLFYMAVFLRDDRPVGIGGLDMNEIRMLFVDPECQRHDIGSSLLRHLEALVPPPLFSDVFVYSAPGAVNFYCRHGYQSGGEHEFVVGRCKMRTIFMTKKLVGAGDPPALKQGLSQDRRH